MTALPVPLSYLLVEHKGQEPVTPFTATLDGLLITVTGILDRSVAYELANVQWATRELAKPAKVLVDPLELRWRASAQPLNPHYGRRTETSPEERAAARQAADAKVAANRRQVEAQKAARKEADAAAARAAVAARRAQEEPVSEAPVVMRIVGRHPGQLDEVKRCKVCLLEKPIDAFRISPLPTLQGSGIRIDTCRQCLNEKNSATKRAAGATPYQTIQGLARLRAVRDAAKDSYDAAQAKLDAAQAKLDAAQAKLDAAQAKLRDLHERLTAALSS